MRKGLVALICVLINKIVSAQTATIVIEDIYWSNHNEWLSTFRAVPSSSANYYAWWKQENGQGDFVFDVQRSGYGGCGTCVTGWHTQIDNEANEYYTFYVDITLPGGQHIISPNIQIGKFGTPQEARLYARKENEAQFGGPIESIGLWTDYTWRWVNPATSGYAVRMMADGDILKINPDIGALGQKFYRGVTSQNDVVYQNYDSYPIDYTNGWDELTFHHRRFYDATIKADLVDALSATVEVKFKDPWLEDAIGYGGEYYSRGMFAPFNSHTSPWTISTSPEYHGVFKDQTPDPNNPLKPYHSVQAPQVPLPGFTWYFSGWTADPVGSAEFQSPLSYQTPVVFRQSGAVVTTKYKAHLGSSLTTAAAPSSQRKLVKWGGYHHLVYPSGGQVWYTYSADNGANWSVEEVLPAVAGYPNVNPSLDVDGLGNVYVAYETQVDGSHRALFLQKKTLAGWDDLLGIPLTFLASAELKPVIAVSKDTYLPKVVAVVQANGYTSSDPGLYYVQVGYPVGKVSETSASSLNPTFTYSNLAYQENNAIYHKGVDFGPNPVTFSSRALVSVSYFNGRPLSNISNPSVAVREAVDYDFSIRPVIAWQATDLIFSTYRPIFVRHPVSTTPDPATPIFVLTVFDWATGNAHGRTPTVTMYQTPPDSGYENPDVSAVFLKLTATDQYGGTSVSSKQFNIPQ